MRALTYPSWWPSETDIGLLDTRGGECSLRFVKSSGTTLHQFCEPAVVRLADGGKASHWGKTAQVWRWRRPETEIQELFPQGWPVKADLVRWYLKKLRETYLGPRKDSYRLLVLDDEERVWVRQLWQETLEDSGFALQGFLSSWQHDLLVAKPGDRGAAMSAYLHFHLQSSGLRWRLIKEGKSLIDGEHFGLTEARLLSQMKSHLRRHASLEVSEEVLAETTAARAELTFPIAGRQTTSGLPSSQIFDWTSFLAGRPSVVEAWREVRSQIFSAAKVAFDGAEGLDLPGWRVLTAGRLAPLFVEGPIIRLWDSDR